MNTRPRYLPELKPLLDQAAQAYRRYDKLAFGRLMRQAATMAPWRLDLGLNLAYHYIQSYQPELAIRQYQELNRRFPTDIHTLVCLAHWQRFAGEFDAADAAVATIVQLRPTVSEDMNRLWRVLDKWLNAAVSDALPEVADSGRGAAIVILGHKLRDDGVMSDELLERLEKGLELARAAPLASIIVSGGLPVHGATEAQHMRDWLIRKGVPRNSIMEEGDSRDLLENIIYSRNLVDLLQARIVFMVGSAINVRRAGAVGEVYAWRNGSAWRVESLAASGQTFASFADDGNDRLKVFRDSLRAFGIPAMLTYPELVDR